MANHKFMLSLDEQQIDHLMEQAKIRGISLQEQLRAVVIPEWLKHNPRKQK